MHKAEAAKRAAADPALLEARRQGHATAMLPKTFDLLFCMFRTGPIGRPLEQVHHLPTSHCCWWLSLHQRTLYRCRTHECDQKLRL